MKKTFWKELGQLKAEFKSKTRHRIQSLANTLELSPIQMVYVPSCIQTVTTLKSCFTPSSTVSTDRKFLKVIHMPKKKGIRVFHIFFSLQNANIVAWANGEKTN